MAYLPAYDPRRRAWADSYIPVITALLKQHAGLFVEFAVADADSDMQRATDLTFRVRGGDVACRVRKAEYWERYRDVTFRHRTRSGAETETAKIRRGYPRWMFYGWANRGEFIAWVLIDLDVVREHGLLDVAEAMGQERHVEGGNVLLFLTLPQLAPAIIAAGGKAAEAASRSPALAR